MSQAVGDIVHLPEPFAEGVRNPAHHLEIRVSDLLDMLKNRLCVFYSFKDNIELVFVLLWICIIWSVEAFNL